MLLWQCWGGGGGHLLEVCLLLEFNEGLEDQAAFAHAQQARRVGCVGEDATCKERPEWAQHHSPPEGGQQKPSPQSTAVLWFEIEEQEA